MNKFKINLKNVDQEINFPVEMDFFSYGQDNDIDIYQEKTKLEIVGKPIDFEVNRFGHSAYTSGNTTNLTSLNYVFYFHDKTSTSVSNINDWKNSYVSSNYFVDEQVYYYRKPFTKSFFKLDLYDSPIERNQTIYLTVIIPVQQGLTEIISPPSFAPVAILPSIDIKRPNFVLDSLGADKEGFYIYWLRNVRFLDLDTFYMSAKFFNGRTGEFISMLNTPQSTLGASAFNFNPSNYFYYKVVLDKTNKVYSIFDNANNRVGMGTPINWYEYVNP